MKLRFLYRSQSNLPKITLFSSALALVCLLFIVNSPLVFAHGVADSDQSFLQKNVGVAWAPYIYLGAKHMVTGYDHLLFLSGVIFFLYRLRDVAIYVSLFAAGHSITLLFGVLTGTHINPYLIDAVIGLSVVYKALENIGGLQNFRWRIDTGYAVFLFGLVHGFGLSTKLQDFTLSAEGLISNMIAFNIGVELGQFLALTFILIAINIWRANGSFQRHAFNANVLMMSAGFMLFGYQITGYFLG